MREMWPAGSYSDTTKEEIHFTACYDRAAGVQPRKGYWSPFATLAWIVSREDQFVAAVHDYEQSHYSNRGGLFSMSSWVVLGNEAAARYGKNFTQASDDLREAVEGNDLTGGIATPIHGVSPSKLEQHEWTAWKLSYEIYGMVLVPGYYDFKWPSEEVRNAFPALDNLFEGLDPVDAPQPWSEERMRAEIAACPVADRDRAWREVFAPIRDTHQWDNTAFRGVWSAGRGTKGLKGRPPKCA